MNQYLSAVNAGEGRNPGEVFGKNAAGNTDALAKKYGFGDKAPTEEEIRIFQGMYKSLDNAKIEDQSGMLDQINTTPIGQENAGEHDIVGQKKTQQQQQQMLEQTNTNGGIIVTNNK